MPGVGRLNGAGRTSPLAHPPFVDSGPTGDGGVAKKPRHEAGGYGLGGGVGAVQAPESAPVVAVRC